MKKFMSEFKKFLKEYKVVGLAVGVIIGTATTKLVNAIVNDIIMPIVEVFIPGEAWRQYIWTFQGIDFQVGNLLGASIDFILIALIVFSFVRFIMGQEEVNKV